MSDKFYYKVVYDVTQERIYIIDTYDGYVSPINKVKHISSEGYDFYNVTVAAPDGKAAKAVAKQLIFQHLFGNGLYFSKKIRQLVIHKQERI